MAEDEMLQEQIKKRITDVLTDAQFPELRGFGRGKVRDFYDIDDRRRLMIATDRQSAFDKILAAVPFKGQVLTSTARFWFDATVDIVGNHVLEYPDPNAMLVRRLAMLPVEVVVRDYLTGSTGTSIWSMYQKGDRCPYGVELPDGMKKNQKLPNTVLTPTTKADAGAHDMPLTPDDIVSKGLLTKTQWKDLEKTALALFARGREIAARRGLILVDTKYEFGLDDVGRLTLADEIHTPDSSRYWMANSYEARFAAGQEPESLDKEFLRLWIAARCDPYREPIPEIPTDTLVNFSAKYIALYETISGQKFQLPPESPPIRERIREHLKKYA